MKVDNEQTSAAFDRRSVEQPGAWLAAELSGADPLSFQVNGFMAVQAIATQEDVALIRAALERLFARQAGRSEGMLFDMAGPDDDRTQARLPQLLDPRNYAPELLKTDFFDNSQRLARTLLGPKARFVADHALRKPPHTGAETPWHQDDAFRPGDWEYREVSIWLPLQPVDLHNGCMAFIPGSGKWEVLPHRPLSGDARIHALECYSGFDPSRAVACPLPAGGCTVHTNRTLHWAGPNCSDAPRLAYVLVFGLPARRTSAAPVYPWLQGRNEPRLHRRREWMRSGGYLVHLARRLRQMPQLGVRETGRRVLEKLGARR